MGGYARLYSVRETLDSSSDRRAFSFLRAASARVGVVPLGVLALASFAVVGPPYKRAAPGASPARRLAPGEAALAAPPDEICACQIAHDSTHEYTECRYMSQWCRVHSHRIPIG
jgi:hypothetical protein